VRVATRESTASAKRRESLDPDRLCSSRKLDIPHGRQILFLSLSLSPSLSLSLFLSFSCESRELPSSLAGHADFREISVSDEEDGSITDVSAMR
jgi:hypothetical protein